MFVWKYLCIVGTLSTAKLITFKNFPDCFGVLCKNNGTLDNTCTCECPIGNEGFECDEDPASLWPDDDYALPEAIFGCPELHSSSWRDVEVHLTLPNDYYMEKTHSWPDLPHFRGPFHHRNVTMHFCIKRKHVADQQDVEKMWPPGNYCIYKQHPCPQGMESDLIKLNGYVVQWVDYPVDVLTFLRYSDTRDQSHTELSVCCQKTSDQSNATSFPRKVPFLLLKSSKSKHCQPIDGMTVIEEWYGFIGSNQNSSERAGKPLSLSYGKDFANVSYCYYKTYDRMECIHRTDTGSSYRGRLNVTQHGLTCLPWERNSLSYSSYSSAILEENYCRKIEGSEDSRPVCFVEVNSQPLQLQCTPEFCYDEDHELAYMYRKFQNIAYRREVDGNFNDFETLALLVNARDWRGSPEIQGTYSYNDIPQPWIRIHLGVRYRVHAVILYRDKCRYPSKWTNMAIWVHSSINQFRSFGGRLCWEIEDLLNVCNIEMRCVQPLAGSYVTIEGYASATPGFIRKTDTRVTFEEIEIYGEATPCRQFFEVARSYTTLYQVDLFKQEIKRNMLWAYFFPVRGDYFYDWMTVQIDLIAISTVEGIGVLFRNDTNLKVTVRYGRGDIIDTQYNDTLVFHANNEGTDDLTVQYFRERIFARKVELHFRSSKPDEAFDLIRFDLIGCPKMVLIDPFCKDGNNYIGYGITYNASVTSHVTYGYKDIRNMNLDLCINRCLSDKMCLTWTTLRNHRKCLLHMSTHYFQYSSRVTSLEILPQGLRPNVIGEKVCIEGVKPAFQCQFELQFENGPMYISNPSYPMHYYINTRCTWNVTFPNQKLNALKITFLDLQIPDAAMFEKTCIGFLSIGGNGRTLQEPHLILTHENGSLFGQSVTYMEKANHFLVNLVSCYRRNLRTAAVFSLKIETSDCAGCRNRFATCLNRSFEFIQSCARTDCGYISTLNFGRLYQPNLVCRWVYYTFHHIRLEFLYFNVPGGENCEFDHVTLYIARDAVSEEITDDSLWNIHDKYCDAHRPETIVYVKTGFRLQFISDETDFGTGFLLRWQEVNGDTETISTPTVLEESYKMCSPGNYGEDYRMYAEYPVKCYLQIDEYFVKHVALSWQQAHRICEQNYGNLVRIDNAREDVLVRSFLQHSSANYTFIGLQRNHTTCQLYDDNNKRHLYMNWAFDDDTVSMEPNGLNENNCLFIKDRIESSGSSLRALWADIDCNHKLPVLIICERPLNSDANPVANKGVYKMDSSNMKMEWDHLYRCKNGEYVMNELRCDRKIDCLDASDEQGCDYRACDLDRLYCGISEPRCVHVNLTCDFHLDCINGADEIGCFYPACKEDEWRCLNGQCIDKTSQNDGVVDCIDKSDENEESSQWRVEIQSNGIFEEGRSSDIHIKVYSGSSSSQFMSFDRRLFMKESSVNVSIALPFSNLTMLRIRYNVIEGEIPWNLKKITLVSKEFGSFNFDCDCVIPDPSSPWIPFRDISVTNPITGSPLLERTAYKVLVQTGSQSESGTMNKVYIAMQGNRLTTAIFELTQSNDQQNLFQNGSTNEFTYVTVDIGSLMMVKVYHFGNHLEDKWYLNYIRIESGPYSTTFDYKRWIGVNIYDSNIAVTLTVPGLNETENILATGSRCQNNFECFDGQCIPMDFYCDQIVHCDGPFHEDEPLVCSPRHLRRSCLDSLVYSNALEDNYDILFNNTNEVFNIHCALGKDEYEGYVVSKVHHSFPYWINITGIKNYPIAYDIADRGIKLLKQNSDFCIQRFDARCIFSDKGKQYEGIEIVDWELIPRWKILIECNLIGGCNCTRPQRDWIVYKYLEYQTDKFTMTSDDRLPFRELRYTKNVLEFFEIGARIHPLECYQKIPNDLYFICNNGKRYNAKYRCVLEYNKYGYPLGCHDYTHISECENFHCPNGYIKCRSGFCIPLHYRCNGIPDCADKEDEKNCRDKFICEGALRCRNSAKCVASSHICDGRSDCPFEDDELPCGNTSDILHLLRIHDESSFHSYSFTNYPFLTILNISSIGLRTLDRHMLYGLKNLFVLDISYNEIRALKENTFVEMSRLKHLIVTGNVNLKDIHHGAFNGLKSIEELDLTNLKISEILSGTFQGLESLRSLNLSINNILILQSGAFYGLRYLQTLDLRENNIIEFHSGVFSSLDSLERLMSDIYLLCCVRPPTVQEYQCFPEKNEFSSCDDLMRNEGLRAFVWVIGISALTGNAFALVHRFLKERAIFKTGNGVLVTNLCIADLLMGVYMVIIGSADAHFRGKYVWNDITWRRSGMCKLAGVISFMSNEMSAAILCLITFDRYVTIRFTLQKVGFSRKSAFVACSICWGICISLALVPLIGLTYFDEDFYTKSGVCLAHPLTNDKGGGWMYATAIFVFFNFFMFMFIAVGQVLIFKEIHNTRGPMSVRQNRLDVAIARKLSLVVITNFLCLFPICIMGLLAMYGFVIDSEIYAWVAVFILPLNSATNPILYTLSSLLSSDIGAQMKRKLLLRQREVPKGEELSEKLQSMHDKGVVTLSMKTGMRSLVRHLKDFDLNVRDMVIVTTKLIDALRFIHSLGYVIGPFSSSEIVLEMDKRGNIQHVIFLAIPTYSEAVDDVKDDVGYFGLVIKEMLSIYVDSQ